MKTKSLAICVVLGMISGLAYGTGVTDTWVGTTGAWATGSNWSQSAAPAVNDNVVITSGTPDMTAASSYTFGGLSVSGTSQVLPQNPGPTTVTLQYDAGYPATATGNLIWNSSQNFEPNGSRAYTIIVDGSFLEKNYNSLVPWVHQNAYAQDKIILRGGNGKTNAYYFNSFRGNAAADNLFPLTVQGTYYDNGTMNSGYGNSNSNAVNVGGALITGVVTNGYFPLTVTSTGRIVANPSGKDSIWTYTKHNFQGGQANLPALGSNVDFGVSHGISDNGLAKYVMTVAGGVTYPRDLYLFGGQYAYTPSPNVAKSFEPFVWRVQKNTGSFTVGRNLNVYDGAAQVRWNHWFYSVENDATNTKVDFTVNGDFTVGTFQATETINPSHYGAKLFGSQVRVGGSLLVGSASSSNNGAMAFDCSTVSIGKDFIVAGGSTQQPSAWTRANWSGGTTATIILDGNGTLRHNVYQKLATWGGSMWGNIGGSGGSPGLTLNNLTINNPGGVVYLDNTAASKDVGSLRLSGNLEIDCGTFKGYGRSITFNGTSHTITNYVNPATYQFDDNLCVLSGSNLYLGSDITIKAGDNLNLQSSSSLVYLNGHKLFAEGQLYDGSNSGLWGTQQAEPYGPGFIVFNAVSAPEPGTLVLLISGALGALGYIRRQRMQ